MTIKHQIIDKKQQANGGSGLAGGEGDGGAGEMSGLASQASALSGAGVGLPGLNSIGGLIAAAASVIAPDTDTIAGLSSQIRNIGNKVASGTQSGIAGMMGQLQSAMSQLQQAMNPDGMKGKVKHHITLDDKKGIKSAAFQEKHYTTWDEKGVTHSSDSKVISRAPQIPHEGNTTVSDNLNVTKIVSASSFVPPSDVRLKSNIADFPAVLDRAMALKVKTFDKKLVTFNGFTQSVHSAPPHASFGLIAQEARELCPELVHGDETKEFLSVHEAKVGILLLAAFQEFVVETRREIAELKARLDK